MTARPSRRPGARRRAAAVEAQETAALRRELATTVTRAAPPRWNADPEDVKRSVAKLVLTLVEFLRRLLERQAIRRMEAGTLTPGEVERLGQALMRLEETLLALARHFDLEASDLNLDLGPLGPLL